VLITSETAEIVRDYVEMNRNGVTDEHGREPLLTSKSGRVVETTIQRYVYTATRPCYYNGGECPLTETPRRARLCLGMLHQNAREALAHMHYVGAM